MKGFRIVGVLLLVGLCAFVTYTVIAPYGLHQAPDVLGLGSAFSGNLQLKTEEIRSVFDAARTKMFVVNGMGERFQIASSIAAWLSFAATATITMMVGFLGRPPVAAGAAVDTAGLPERPAHWIGFLAALAAVLTACSSMSVNKAQEYFKLADDMRDAIVHARQAVIDAKTANAAQAILDDLRLKVAR